MRLILAATAAAFMLNGALAQDLRSNLFADADRAREAALAANAELLAPQSFARGQSAYDSASSDLERGRNMDRIRSRLEEAVTAFTDAAENARLAEITFATLLQTREDAMTSRAATFASDLWSQAENEFSAAAQRLDAGDIRGAQRRAENAEATYRDAELAAIKAQHLSQTRALIAQARDQRVQRFAPLTMERAQALLERAEQELAENRYDTDLPRSLAQDASRAARHALFLSDEVQRIRDQRLSTEEIILSYEDPLVRIAAAADQVAALDQGTGPVADDLVRYIEDLRDAHQQADNDLQHARARVRELEEEIRRLDERLGGMSQERATLVQRIEAEERVRQQFATIEDMFDREEARVSREGNTVVLRMVGLTFATASAAVDASHRPLLEKVRRAAEVFPRSQVVIEGHTDSMGNDQANMALSQRRAEAVSAYLSEQLGLPAIRILAIGYGETRPIASNETPQGRERNRRIDVRIEPQLD